MDIIQILFLVWGIGMTFTLFLYLAMFWWEIKSITLVEFCNVFVACVFVWWLFLSVITYHWITDIYDDIHYKMKKRKGLSL